MKNTKNIISMIAAISIAMCAVSCGDGSAASSGRSAGTAGGSAKASAGATEAEKADKTDAGGAEAAMEAEDGVYEGETGELADGDVLTGEMTAGDAEDVKKSAVEGEGDAQANSAIPEAGQLTAGEWRDNDNWGFLMNLVNSGTISFPSYGIDPRGRVAVTVKNESGEAAANVAVNLLGEDNELLWSAVTDKNGRAYLFTPEGKTAAGVEATNSEGKTQSAEVKANSSGGEQGGSEVSDYAECELTLGGNELYKKTEIMFIVDTTGSMSDEMLFLQSEFSAIAKEVGTEDTYYSANFYRDEGDDYVTKLNDFTNDVSTVQSQINAESADGGGDFPEAVGKIMNETLSNGKWSDDSVKIAFMIFDAPPHEEDSDEVAQAVKDAAKKGIRLVPIVSSNTERDTELFARGAAICTGGSYVFLTDDSGIGDSHLEPIIGDYKVEKLHDIIVRIIGDYRQ